MSERRTFAHYTDETTTILGGFNYWETSLLITTFNGLARVRMGNIYNRHIVVIEDIRRDKNRRRTDWYFGVFDLPEDVNCPHMDEITKLVVRKNRVAGKDLNMRILQAAEEVWDTE